MEWRQISALAHQVCFNHDRKADVDRVDFALLSIGEDNKPRSFSTFRETDSESLYWQYGGVFPGVRGTIYSLKEYRSYTDWAQKQNKWKRINKLVDNKNTVMLKMALHCGYRIIGCRNFKGDVLLECLKEFNERE